MKSLDIDSFNGNACTLLNLMKEIPGTSICYRDTKGTFLWHNKYIVRDLNLTQNLIGKTLFDILSIESATKCHKEDLEIIAFNKIVAKECKIQLLNGEIREYYITKIPWSIELEKEKINGVIVNAVNKKNVLCTQIKPCRASNKLYDKVLDIQLKTLHFDIVESVKEIMLLTNLIMSDNIINNDIKSLCLELKYFTKILLSNYHKMLASSKVFSDDTKESTILPKILSKINLRTFIPAILNKQISIIKFRNAKLSLAVSSQIPEIISGDLFRIKKILQLIANCLLRSDLEYHNMEINMHCNIEVFHKVNYKNIIISFTFKVNNYLLKNIINDEQHLENELKLISILNMVTELEGHMEEELINNNQINSKITIYLPFIVTKH